MADNGTLSPKQRRVIAALLSERNTTDAAEVAGVATRTIYRWLADPAFVKELRQAEAAILDAASVRLISGLGVALQVLYDMMTDERTDPTNRRSAAIAWLAHSLRLLEARNLEERLTALEAKLEANK